MERLTDRRGARSWFLFHLGWYLNLLLFLSAMVAALYFFVRVMNGSESDLHDAVMMMAFVILAAILLLGAGISRYQARLEGQHLELKKTILVMGQRLSALESEEEQKGEPAQV